MAAREPSSAEEPVTLAAIDAAEKAAQAGWGRTLRLHLLLRTILRSPGGPAAGRLGLLVAAGAMGVVFFFVTGDPRALVRLP